MRGAAVAVLGLMVTACAATPFGAPTATPKGEAEKGYLSSAALGRLADGVPPPSADGSVEQIADRARSERYRMFENSDRWLLATAHSELSPELAPQHFDCALGVRFASARTPRLTVMFEKLLHDADTVAETVKARDFRPRPVGVDPDRAACQRVSPAGRASASYPSGSATVGAAYGAVLALADPDHAAAAREIGHQIGVSRIVCAMHFPADVAPGEALGRAVVAEAVASPAFQADLLEARAEIATARATGLTSPACAAERAALAVPLP